MLQSVLFIQGMKSSLLEVFEGWGKYAALWSEEREKVVKAFVLSDPGVADFEAKINELLAMKNQVWLPAKCTAMSQRPSPS